MTFQEQLQKDTNTLLARLKAEADRQTIENWKKAIESLHSGKGGFVRSTPIQQLHHCITCFKNTLVYIRVLERNAVISKEEADEFIQRFRIAKRLDRNQSRNSNVNKPS